MRFQVLDEAKEEVAQAFAWYEKRSPQTAHRFADLLADALTDIHSAPARPSLCDL